MSTTTTRQTTEILDGALDELREREERLVPFVAELDDVRRAIKTIEKASSGPTTGATTQRARAALPRRTQGVTDEVRDKVLAAARKSFDPLSRDTIAGALGVKPGPYVYGVIATLVREQHLVEVEGGYGLPPNVQTHLD